MFAGTPGAVIANPSTTCIAHEMAVHQRCTTLIHETIDTPTMKALIYEITLSTLLIIFIIVEMPRAHWK